MKPPEAPLPQSEVKACCHAHKMLCDLALADLPMVSFSTLTFATTLSVPAMSMAFMEPRITVELQSSMPPHILRHLTRICPGSLLLHNKPPGNLVAWSNHGLLTEAQLGGSHLGCLLLLKSDGG